MKNGRSYSNEGEREREKMRFKLERVQDGKGERQCNKGRTTTQWRENSDATKIEVDRCTRGRRRAVTRWRDTSTEGENKFSWRERGDG